MRLRTIRAIRLPVLHVDRVVGGDGDPFRVAISQVRTRAEGYPPLADGRELAVGCVLPPLLPGPQPGRGGGGGAARVAAVVVAVLARRVDEGVQAGHVAADEGLEADEVVAPDADVGLPDGQDRRLALRVGHVGAVNHLHDPPHLDGRDDGGSA